MVNWASVAAKSIGVAAAEIKSKRDAESLRLKEFQEKKDLLDYQHANAMNLQASKNTAKVEAARIDAGKELAAKSKITVGGFRIAGQLVPVRQFTYGGQNVSAQEYTEGLKNAYAGAVNHFRFLRDNLMATPDRPDGLQPNQVQELWSKYYKPNVSTATASLFTKYAQSEGDSRKMPPEISTILGVDIGTEKVVQDLWSGIYRSTFSADHQERMLNWAANNKKFNSNLFKNSGIAPTLNSSVWGRLSESNPFGAYAPTIMQSQTFHSATQIFDDAAGEFSKVNAEDALYTYGEAVRKALKENNPDEQQMGIIDTFSTRRLLQIAGDTTNLAQSARVRDGIDTRLSDWNSNFDVVKPSANLQQQRNSAENLSIKIVEVVRDLKQRESVAPLTSPAATGILTTLSSVVVGVGEALPFLRKFINADGVLKTGSELLQADQDRPDQDLATKLLGDISEGRAFTGDDQEQFNIIKAKLEAAQRDVDEAFKGMSADGPAAEQAMRTYNFHMNKLYLAYAYSKYLQGGAGGNAVSNADFQNTMNALFGTFGVNKEQNRDILVSGMMRMHHGVQKDIQKYNQQDRYTHRFGKDSYITTTKTAQNIREMQYRNRSAIVNRTSQPGENYYDNVNEYWSLFNIGEYKPDDPSSNTFGKAGKPKQIIPGERD